MTKDSASFAAAFGASIPITGEFPSSLAPSDLLQLKSSDNKVISEVRFENVAPWPAILPGSAVSLQLIDAAQDARRISNWATSITPPFASPGAPNSVAETLPDFPKVWINEVESQNLTGLRDTSGQPKPWLELFNSGTNVISLEGLSLSGDFSDLGKSPFPLDTQLAPGQFWVVFADGQPQLSSAQELHTSFALSSGGGSIALSRVVAGQLQVLDYLKYPELPANHSFGSVPDGQPIERIEFETSTPGAPNQTEPTAPHIELLSFDRSNLSLQWQTVPGHRYRIESKDDLNAPAWQDFLSQMIAGSSVLSTNIPAAQSGDRFLRVVDY